MTFLESAGLAALHRLDPETAHGLALKALRLGLAPQTATPTSPRITTRLGDLELPNPVGLAAGFDKNATAVDALLGSGFGFIEVGAVTPRAQAGNPRPRLFRLTEDRAAINRFGFNNDGAYAIAKRLAAAKSAGVVGINLGANKDSADRAADFASVLATTAAHVDFATVNVSSPNTEHLRDLQGRDALEAVLDTVMTTNAGLPEPRPICLKVAPDLTETQIDEMAEVALNAGITAVFATNTTLARTGLQSHHASESGGLSGAPLFDRSTSVLAHFARRLDNRIPLVGIGGISTARDVLTKIEAGASAVQLYTAMVFDGISLAPRLAGDLDTLMHAEGYASITAARGTRIAELAGPL